LDCFNLVALNEEGIYPWQEFSGRLATVISSAEKDIPEPTKAFPNDPSEYYQHWLASLESLLLEQGVVTPHELEAEIATQIHHDVHDHD